MFSFAVLAASLPAQAAPPTALSSMVGSWTCTGKVGGVSETSTIVATAWGQWIRDDISFPAVGKYPASAGTAYLGWDSTHKEWVYNEVDQVGEYFITTSSSPKWGKTAWAARYPPEAGTSIINMLSKNAYTVDVSYSENGKPATFHQRCTRT